MQKQACPSDAFCRRHADNGNAAYAALPLKTDAEKNAPETVRARFLNYRSFALKRSAAADKAAALLFAGRLRTKQVSAQYGFYAPANRFHPVNAAKTLPYGCLILFFCGQNIIFKIPFSKLSQIFHYKKKTYTDPDHFISGRAAKRSFLLLQPESDLQAQALSACPLCLR